MKCTVFGLIAILTLASFSSAFAAEVTKRAILADGTIEITYSDKHIKHISVSKNIGDSLNISTEMINPDDMQSSPRYKSTNVEPFGPPQPPLGNQVNAWLKQLNERLLILLRKTLRNDSKSINNYEKFEDGLDLNLYQKMDIRVKFLNNLLAEY